MATLAAQSIPLQRVSMKAKGAVVANRVLKLNTTEGEALHTIAITEVVIGVSIDTVADGTQMTVEIGSGAIVKFTAKGAVTAGDALMPAAEDSGKVSTLAGATAVCCGQALQGAADGAVFTGILRQGVRTPVMT